jgi:hypothetical protein
MYWSEPGIGAIRRANIDGSGPIETLASAGDAGGGIALDIDAGKMYFCAGSTPLGSPTSNPRICRANLDGSGQEDLVTNNLFHPVGIALDTLRGKVYWTDLEGNLDGTGQIQRANLDGSNVETLLTGIDEANGIAVDPIGERIYWPELATKKIQRANLAGTGVQDLVTGLDTPATIAVDVADRKMYWTDGLASGQVNRITRANLDGSEVEVIVSGVGFPWGVAVESGTQVDLIKAVKPAFSYLFVGTNYQLQVSTDLTTWTNQGSPFTATNNTIVYPQYWDVDNWQSLFFRLRQTTP